MVKLSKSQKKRLAQLREERARNAFLLEYSIKRRREMIGQVAPQEFIDRYCRDIGTFKRRLEQLDLELSDYEDMLRCDTEEC